MPYTQASPDSRRNGRVLRTTKVAFRLIHPFGPAGGLVSGFPNTTVARAASGGQNIVECAWPLPAPLFRHSLGGGAYIAAVLVLILSLTLSLSDAVAGVVNGNPGAPNWNTSLDSDSIESGLITVQALSSCWARMRSRFL